MASMRAGWLIAAVLLALGIAESASADEFTGPGMRKHHHWIRHRYHHFALPPERHVIEVVRHAYSTQFIINGLPFIGTNACALGWAAGQQVRLRAGSWHGACAVAVFYNVPLRQSCPMWCPGAAY